MLPDGGSTVNWRGQELFRRLGAARTATGGEEKGTCAEMDVVWATHQGGVLLRRRKMTRK